MFSLPENLQIRRGRDSDLPEMARIYNSSYPNAGFTLNEAIEQFRTNPRMPLEDYWVCEKDNHLAGLFALYNFRMNRIGNLIPVGGIGSVAVPPEARRGRIAYWLMAKAVDIMEQNRIPLSMLYPFKHSFYNNLGWGTIGRVNLYRFDPASLPNFPERDNIRPVISTEEQESVMKCYRLYGKRQNGILERDDPYWYEVVFKNSHCYAYLSPDSGTIEGYLTYRYKPYPLEKDFTATDIDVWDFVWNSKKAFHGLLGFLASQRDQVKIINFPDRSNLPLDLILREPRMPDGKHDWVMGAETVHVGSSLMGRIIKLRQAIKLLKLPEHISGKVTLEIEDNLNEANNEPLTIEIDKGMLEFKPRLKANITFKSDISTLSSLYWGILNIKEAILLGKADIEGKGDAAFLTRLFEVPSPICLDHF